jgi:hypothetical protein
MVEFGYRVLLINAIRHHEYTNLFRIIKSRPEKAIGNGKIKLDLKIKRKELLIIIFAEQN